MQLARVIKAFRERYRGFKRYNPGDEYPEDMPDRVIYLVKLGFLAGKSIDGTDAGAADSSIPANTGPEIAEAGVRTPIRPATPKRRRKGAGNDDPHD